MPATTTQARDEMYGRVKALVDTILFVNRPTIAWDDGSDNKNPPQDSHAWMTVQCKHIEGGQSTLSGGLGKNRYKRSGFLLVQVNTPSGSGLVLSEEVTQLVRNGFEGYATPNGVWFRNARIQEVGTIGNFFRVNVLVDFEYEEYH